MNTYPQSKTVELETFVEDLDIALGDGVWVNSANLVLQVDYEGYDPGSYDTPPCGGTAVVSDILRVKDIAVCDEKTGDEITTYPHNLTKATLEKVVKNELVKQGWMNTSERDDWATDSVGSVLEKD